MTSRRTRTVVPYSADEMFDLVADVDKYPQFIPHCSALRLISTADTDGKRVLTAEMIVSYHGLRERFRCRVQLDRKHKRIDVDYLEGPFRKLHNRWIFADLDDGSEVDFTIDFEFRNFLLQAAASAAFEHAFMRMSEAFIRRAHSVYGEYRT